MPNESAIPDVARMLPYHFASRHRAFLKAEDDGYVLLTAGTPPAELLGEVYRWLGVEFRWQCLGADEFNRELTRHYQDTGMQASSLADDLEGSEDLEDIADLLPTITDLMDADDDAPVIRLLNALMAQAIRERASDIHVEVFEDHVSVRFRVDGVLHEVMRQQRALASLLVSRLKVMAGLDIAERRLPQDGRISVRIAGHPVDIRLSTLPSTFGERAVMRLLDRAEGVFRIETLHMPAVVQDIYLESLQQAYGIILVTGPTGSGKTTTLYAGLNHLNQQTRNIMTIEDPVEYMLPGIAQTQVNNRVDMNFARGLRAILRQDPDVVMVGEIRDAETARIAVQASLTGHLVLSTLHTNTAIGAITRLQDMGIEPFLLASSLRAVFAQRLVRLLCTHCREPYEASSAEKTRLGADEQVPLILYRATGCAHCHQKGYHGRTGVFEAVRIDATLRDMIHDRASEHAMTEYARLHTHGMQEDGQRLVREGLTTLEELLRVTTI